MSFASLKKSILIDITLHSCAYFILCLLQASRHLLSFHLLLADDISIKRSFFHFLFSGYDSIYIPSLAVTIVVFSFTHFVLILWAIYIFSIYLACMHIHIAFQMISRIEVTCKENRVLSQHRRILTVRRYDELYLT